MSKKKSTPVDDRVANPGAWQGTLPADGTRRAVVLKAIEAFFGADLGVVKAPLELADAIELAQLEHADAHGAPPVEGAETWRFEFVEVNDLMTDDNPKRHWRLSAGNGDTIAQSEGYETEEQAEQAAEKLKAHARRAGFPIGA